MRTRFLVGALALGAFTLAPSGALAASNGARTSDFTQLSAVLARVDSYSRVSSTQVISFDEGRAAAAGMDARGRRLGREMVAFANSVVQSDKSGRGIAAAGASLEKLTALNNYMKKATAFEKQTSSTRTTGPSPPKARASFGDNYWTYRTCGSFASPRPTVGKNWITWNTSNPVGVLWSWGYHPTPGWAGGGWTRDQTYKPWLCGWRTFRDHAYIVGTQIREQNYSGWNPRGEPNPELWRVGPWPYATWPAYVYWWHQTR